MIFLFNFLELPYFFRVIRSKSIFTWTIHLWGWSLQKINAILIIFAPISSTKNLCVKTINRINFFTIYYFQVYRLLNLRNFILNNHKFNILLNSNFLSFFICFIFWRKASCLNHSLINRLRICWIHCFIILNLKLLTKN